MRKGAAHALYVHHVCVSVCARAPRINCTTAHVSARPPSGVYSRVHSCDVPYLQCTRLMGPRWAWSTHVTHATCANCARWRCAYCTHTLNVWHTTQHPLTCMDTYTRAHAPHELHTRLTRVNTDTHALSGWVFLLAWLALPPGLACSARVLLFLLSCLALPSPVSCLSFSRVLLFLLSGGKQKKGREGCCGCWCCACCSR